MDRIILLKNSIRKFKRLNHLDMKDEDLQAALQSVVTPTHNSSFEFPVVEHQFPAGTEFFRVRVVKDDDHIIPLRCLRNSSDVVEPPRERVTAFGRANRPRQRILYACASDPLLAFAEAKVTTKRFLLTSLLAKRDIHVSAIGGDFDFSSYPEHEGLLYQEFYDFLEYEFTKDVPAGSERLYRVGLFAAESYFTYPLTDAWVYRSAIDRNKFNTAFLEEKRSACLEIKGTMICDTSQAQRGNISVNFVAAFDNTGMASYHQIGSEHQKQLFPEIQQRA